MTELPIGALTAASAPDSSSASWSVGFADRSTVKAVRPLAAGEAGGLFWTDGSAAGSAAVAVLGAGGQRPRRAPPVHGARVPATGSWATQAPPRGARSTTASSTARAPT